MSIHIHKAVTKAAALSGEQRGQHKGVFAMSVIALRLNLAAVLQKLSACKLQHMNAVFIRFLIVFAHPAFNQKYAPVVPRGQKVVLHNVEKVSVLPDCLRLLGIMLLEPFARAMGEFEHGAPLLQIGDKGIEHDAAVVHLAYIGAADAVVGHGIEAYLLNAVTSDYEVVGHERIFLVIAAPDVVFLYDVGHEFGKLFIALDVRRDDRLREVVEKIRANILDSAVDDRRDGSRFARLAHGYACPVVAVVHSLAELKS